VTPRVIALVVIMPLLVTFADLVGVYGGYLISTVRLGFNETIYISNTKTDSYTRCGVILSKKT
jgi:phospholipid/cholesterol/gamma-HCH transport system permease protein